MKKSHIEYFSEAYQRASGSFHSKFKHGSVVVNRNTIVGSGCNRFKIHAEVSSLLATKIRYEGVWSCMLSRSTIQVCTEIPSRVRLALHS